MMAMSSFFRMVGSVSRTSAQTMAPVSIAVLIFVVYSGFVIPANHMLPWLRWLQWLNPIAYAYESLMINEVSTKSANMRVSTDEHSFTIESSRALL
jgi:ATP-binding cassette, subfamily G (WHITE), member 2, PDR